MPPPGETADVPAQPSVTYELRDYGAWVTVPEYGYVWRPYVATGWSPYVYGRWVWISPYGWTWVSNEPWGWYPYRCGYWVTIPAFGWVWYPYNAFVSVSIGVGTPWRPYYGYGGYPYYYRTAYYYPANVRFVPEGRQVRWVLLNPGERYRPAGVRRGDPSLAGWNRPLEKERVYVRGAPGASQARDYTAVRTEQQARTRQTIQQRSRKDTRPVRPEVKKDARTPASRQPEAAKERKDTVTAMLLQLYKRRQAIAGINVEMIPRHAVGFGSRVELLAGDYAAAERTLRAVLQERLRDANAWYNLGLALELQRRPDEAERAYRQAIHIDPSLQAAAIALQRLRR